MSIRITRTDAELTACLPVLRELRPQIAEDELFVRVRRQEAEGYRLAFLQVSGEIVTVAGFWIRENLAWERFLYVDDLVTRGDHRSQGHGTRMLSWLREYAVREGCRQLHLDSGMQREGAHRFYAREGMETFGLHFAETLAPAPAPGSAKTRLA